MASASAAAAAPRRRLAASRTVAAILSASPCTSSERFSDVSARARTSSATTAKPRPSSPARAASIAAFKARRLVWSAMSATLLVISPIRAAWPSRVSITPTLASWRLAFIATAFTDPSIAAPVSVSKICKVSVRRRAASACARAWAKDALICVTAAKDSWAAPAASSAPLAIWDNARRSSSTALDASVMPPASSSVAALIRSPAFSRRDTALRTGTRLTGVATGSLEALFELLPRVARVVVFTSAIDAPLARPRPSLTLTHGGQQPPKRPYKHTRP